MERTLGSMGEIVGLVVAAGASRRMGPSSNKLVEEVGGRPLLQWPIDALRGAGVDRVVVVVGFAAESVRAAVEAADEFVVNEDWSAGMGSSIACGVRAIAERGVPRALLVCVGDLPALRSPEVGRLLEVFEEDPGPTRICVPTHDGVSGHPVLFGAAHLPTLARLEGEQGGRSLVEGHPECVLHVPVDSPGIRLDVDTPADLDAARD